MNDSHYCWNSNGISNQLYHSIGGFNVAYFGTSVVANLGTHIVDINPSPFGWRTLPTRGFASYEDIWLGERMADFGQALKDGTETRGGMSRWIMDNIATTTSAIEKLKAGRFSRQNIIDSARYTKNFRVLEYQLNGDVHNKWGYNEDVQSYDCGNEKKIYYQDYGYIFVNGENVGGAKAVWDDSQQKMLLMYWGLRDQYDTPERICSNLTELINQHGISLNMSFEQMKDAL